MLNPTMPDEGEDLEDHLRNKYGKRGVQMLHDPNAYLYTAGRKVGIEFTTQRRMVRTQKAHALMEYVKDEIDNDTANKLMEEMFCRYFEHGDDVNDDESLVRMAVTVGIEEASARDALEDGRRLWHVEEQDRLYKRGISGVPFFIIDRKGGDGKRPIRFSGALPADIMAEQLEEAIEEE
mmetsp:Transcript_100210/g.150242  ORF Transcript_100210/g.150242 Transcript_100210/m.150242 type:complete len:179 (-) Transcript_100210:368-904(-)